jgi:hypothetical protein
MESKRNFFSNLAALCVVRFDDTKVRQCVACARDKNLHLLKSDSVLLRGLGHKVTYFLKNLTPKALFYAFLRSL